ncbi:MAG: FHA domain-containing protein [Chloroflexi bacterium]|nr:FHA domain-containing protein [Chloroflexota bacterium]
MSTDQGLRIALTIASDTRTGQMKVVIADSLVIGRASASGPEAPDLDLTPYGGAESGVSRAHAALVYADGHLFVEDLGSTSGTRINGFTLTPGQKYRLRSQDELEFGRVRMTLRLIE